MADRTQGVQPMDYQTRVYLWVTTALGRAHANDPIIRGLRFLEEAIELAQTVGVSPEQARYLVGLVYAKPPGDRDQEIGGCALTLNALASAVGTDLELAGEREYARVNTPEMITKIRERNLTKPLPTLEQERERQATYRPERETRGRS